MFCVVVSEDDAEEVLKLCIVSPSRVCSWLGSASRALRAAEWTRTRLVRGKFVCEEIVYNLWQRKGSHFREKETRSVWRKIVGQVPEDLISGAA